jgi:hypothetical protein
MTWAVDFDNAAIHTYKVNAKEVVPLDWKSMYCKGWAVDVGNATTPTHDYSSKKVASLTDYLSSAPYQEYRSPMSLFGSSRSSHRALASSLNRNPYRPDFITPLINSEHSPLKKDGQLENSANVSNALAMTMDQRKDMIAREYTPGTP